MSFSDGLTVVVSVPVSTFASVTGKPVVVVVLCSTDDPFGVVDVSAPPSAIDPPNGVVVFINSSEVKSSSIPLVVMLTAPDSVTPVGMATVVVAFAAKSPPFGRVELSIAG